MLTQTFHIIDTRHHDEVALQLFIDSTAMTKWSQIEVSTLGAEFEGLLLLKYRFHLR